MPFASMTSPLTKRSFSYAAARAILPKVSGTGQLPACAPKKAECVSFPLQESGTLTTLWSVVVIGMPRSVAFTCDDPIPYQSAIRGADVTVSVTAKGEFRGKLLQIDLRTLWMQSGWENLPRVVEATTSPMRMGVFFAARAAQPTLKYCGTELSPGAIVAVRPGSLFHFRSEAPSRWAAMSLPVESFAAASRALLGYELNAGPTGNLFLCPNPSQMAQLSHLHAAARHLAVAAPETLVHPEVSNALENQLVHAMVTCMADQKPTNIGSKWRHHTAIINRFVEVLAANFDRPIYLAEICAIVGASERTLRASCEEHLGMGPIRYLWLRRMHLARRALLHADPAKATVTQVATASGSWGTSL